MSCGNHPTTGRPKPSEPLRRRGCRLRLVPLGKLRGVSSRTVTRQVRTYEFFAIKLARWLVLVEDDGPGSGAVEVERRLPF
jgi:hypothetical protein